MGKDDVYKFETFCEDLAETLICGQYKDAVEMISKTNYELDEIMQSLCISVGVGKTMTLLCVMQNEGYILLNKNYKDKKD
jgi:hypothetical protein